MYSYIYSNLIQMVSDERITAELVLFTHQRYTIYIQRLLLQSGLNCAPLLPDTKVKIQTQLSADKTGTFSS